MRFVSQMKNQDTINKIKTWSKATPRVTDGFYLDSMQVELQKTDTSCNSSSEPTEWNSDFSEISKTQSVNIKRVSLVHTLIHGCTICTSYDYLLVESPSTAGAFDWI